MNNLSRKLLSLIPGLLLTCVALAETDQIKLRETGMFDDKELNSLPGNYAVVEFSFSPAQFPPASQQPMLPGTTRNSRQENVLYLGVWGKPFKDYDTLRTYMFPSRFYMKNDSKSSDYGTFRFKMDLHSPQTAAYGEDNWTMITGAAVRSLAEKPAAAAHSELVPLPFPYRAVNTDGYSCRVHMIAAFDPAQEYTLTVNRGQDFLTEGLLQNKDAVSFSFDIPQGKNTYQLNLKKGRHTSRPTAFNKTYGLPESLQGRSGWLPIPVDEDIIMGSVKWTPETAVYIRFQDKVPVKSPKKLDRGGVYWLFLQETPVTLNYSYFLSPETLNPETLSSGWHLIARDAYGLNEQNIQTLISTGIIHPMIYFFNAEAQEYQLQDSSKPLAPCLFIRRN